MRTLRFPILALALACGPVLALSGCDDMESKARDSNKKHDAARDEVRKTLLPLAAKALPNIVPVTLDIRVDASGTITKCLSNRAELPGCSGLTLKNGENSSFTFSMEEVEEIRKLDKPLKESTIAPKAPAEPKPAE
ncbi:MAG TPA: hypothetical protein VGK67_02770 [Myxococcales bacterium]|jgi:hypothetical protein